VPPANPESPNGANVSGPTASLDPETLGNEEFVRQTRRRAFLVPILVMFAFVAVLGFQIRQLVIETADLEHSHTAITLGQKTEKLLVDMETGARGYLLTGLEEFLEPYRKAKPQIEPSLIRLEKLVARRPDQLRRLAEISERDKSWLIQTDQQLAHRADVSHDNSIAIEKKHLMDQMRDRFDSFLEIEARTHEAIESHTRQTTALAAFSAVVLALMIGSSFGYYNRLQLDRLSTNYRDQQVRLNEARTAAEESNRAKDSFLAMLSHELRNPLNILMLSAQSLRRGGPNAPGADRALIAIERSVKNLEKMIADLLDSSRIVSGKLTLEIKLLDGSALIRNAVDTVRAAAVAKQIRLVTELDSNCPPVSADPDRIQQVLWNLLSNAIKFTPAGGEVRASMRISQNSVRITISDTGEGIATEDLGRVFGRFWQGKATAGRSRSGLGLGLSIARSLVELHGGTLSARSDGVGRGTTFELKLPIQT
jgi:signal transduction histidine kinase